MKVRKMTAEDILAVAELERECFPEPWSADELRKSLEQENYIFYAAEDDARQVVGYVGCYQILDEGNITNVAVTAEARQKKVGSRLIEALLKECVEREIAAVTLEVRESNQNAIKLYQKYNFSIEGIRRNYYRHPTEHAYIMWNYDIAATARNCR